MDLRAAGRRQVARRIGDRRHGVQGDAERRQVVEVVEEVQARRLQHLAGRRLTDQLLANPKDTKAIEQFTRMYQPHAAFEDTIVFPAWKKLVGKKAYAELGETFEDEETKQLGKEGFEHVLAQIAEIEKNAGIGDIAIYTP